MSSIQNHGRSMLKLAQFESFGYKEKYIDLILQELDLNSKVSRTSYLEKYNNGKIGNTLLHMASEKEDINAFDALILKGTDFNAKDSRGHTVLHNAFEKLISQYFFFKWNILKNELCGPATRCIQFIVSTLSAHVKYKNTRNLSDSNGVTHFHVACATNNIEAVKSFLNSGTLVNQVVTKAISNQYFEGYTVLHFAAQFGNLEVIQILLKHGANTNLEDAKGRTPLHISLERNIAMIESTKEASLPSDIEINEQVSNLLMSRDLLSKYPYLNVASSMHNLSKVHQFLAQEPDVNQCIHMDSKVWPGYTALHFAAHVNVDTVKLLVKHGADIEAKDVNNVTPFDLCIDRYKVEDICDIIGLVPKWKSIVLSDGKTKLTDLLLALKNSDAISNFLLKSDDNVKLFVPIDSPLWPGFTILHVAVLLSERKKCKLDYKNEKDNMHFKPDLSVVTECLSQGADVTTKDQRNWTPVHLAFRLDKNKVLNLLLQYHYKMQNPVDDDNLSHLHIACAVENENFVERLLWNGIDPNVAYKGKTILSSVFTGSTPLHVAIFEGEEKIAKALLKFGANPHASDAHSFTPMHHLIRHEFSYELSEKTFSTSDLFDLLVEDVGLSYLHVACDIPNVEAVRRLLDLGVDINGLIHDNDHFKNLVGNTPLHMALRSLNCSVLVVGLLLERGADLLTTNSRGFSPLDMILEYGWIHGCLEALLSALIRDEDLRRRVEMETGVTMLHIACHKVDVDLVKELLEDGADVIAKIRKDWAFWLGWTPLHVAYDKLLRDSNGVDSRLTQVSLLLKAHRNFEVNPTSIEGISHFHIACHRLEVDVVENFLNAGQVDVNATIDVFYRSKIAACSPLLLATRKTNWRKNDLSVIESSPQLRIVDSLIESGARVDVEDIDGNTPAHYAIDCDSLGHNYLQRLANSGANVNARNLRGETPLELLIKKERLKLEDARYFIACGCVFNAFTLDTEEGYIAQANFLFVPDDIATLLREAFSKYPDLMKRDSANRSAVHNIVSADCCETDEKELAELIDIITEFGCDVDDQDNLGRTPLHLAAQFRNKIAIEALLLVGADVDIVDHGGKTPFAYLFDPCPCMRTTTARYHDQYRHPEVFYAFINHFKKLYISDLGVIESNARLDVIASDRLDFYENTYDMEDFHADFRQMRNLEIEPHSVRLVDFMYNANAVYEYPRMTEAKRNAIDEFFERNRSEFRRNYPDAAGIFQLQYRQAVLRRKMMIAAKDSLSVLARFRVPDVCSDIVLRFLENDELRNLIASTA